MTGAQGAGLSRSRCLDGLRCPRLLWLRARRSDLLPDAGPDEAAWLRAEDARVVRLLACGLWPGGVAVVGECHHQAEAVEATRRALADRAVPAVFGAAFTHDGVDLRVDVLARADGAADPWDLVAVKATTSIKVEHVLDLALQAHVLRGCGVGIRRAGVLHLDREYVRGEDGLDLRGLFVFHDTLPNLDGEVALVPGHLDALRAVLALPEAPAAAPVRRCHEPRECPPASTCITPPGRYDIATLPRSTRLVAEMAAVGVTDVRDIPAGTRLTPTQARVVRCLVEEREHVGPGLRAALEAVEYPLLFLDFETFAPAVPRYPGTSPYQPLPTQWSLHRLGADGRLDHAEYLHDGDDDTRLQFLEVLLDAVGDEGSVVVYSGYEATQLRWLARDFPTYATAVDGLLVRIVDLLAVFRKHYITRTSGAPTPSRRCSPPSCPRSPTTT